MVLKKLNTDNGHFSITRMGKTCKLSPKPAFSNFVTLDKALNEKYLYKKAVKEAWGWKEEKIGRGHKRDLPSLQIFAMKSFQNIRKQAAFSLVELLMALLVASLLMAALAPVMTRKVKDADIKILAEAANYDKDSVITIFTDASEQKEFNIPLDANKITMTLMGGGGAGGNANWGNMIVTNSGPITLPDGVDKIRVFMVGGGGGGAAGGYGTGTVYETIPSKAEDHQDFKTGGQFNFTNFSAAQKLPAMDPKCAASGIDKWTLSNNTSLKFAPNSSVLRITACGGGGGGGGGGSADPTGFYGGGGGTGGYFEKRILVLQPDINKLEINVGGYGGGGGGDNYVGINGGSWQGGAGGSGTSSVAISSTQSGYGYGGISPNDHYGTGGGGGYGCNNKGADGGSASVLNGFRNIVIEGGTGENGAGNGGSVPAAGAYTSSIPHGAGGGGGGGCLTAGGGGGGAGAGSGGGGGGATFITGYMNFNNVSLVAPGGGGGGGGDCYGTTGANSSNHGGGGGGGGGLGGGNGGHSGGYSSVSDSRFTQVLGHPGKGGMPGGKAGIDKTGGTITTVFGTGNCGGGNAGQGGANNVRTASNGQPGAMRIHYGGEALQDYIKCDFNGGNTTGGGGGGAGQITVTEINVPNSKTLYFKIGAGGEGGKTLGQAGKDGGDTAIYANSESGSRLAIANGGSAGLHEGAIAGTGGGANIIKNWMGLNFSGGKSGNNGHATTDSTSAGFGGKGGDTQFYKHSTKEIITVYGGNNGGNAAKTGGTPKENSLNAANNVYYGAGGGGGFGTTGVADAAGIGGDGAPGYIYIEWGGTNGGGGTNGEIVQRVLTNFDPADRKMIINIGRGGTDSVNNGKGGDTVISVKSGGKNVTVSARGGIKGNDGNLDIGNHGGEMKYPDNYNELYKEFVQGNMNIILGQKGENDYGGMGGYLACLYYSKDNEGNKTCAQSIKANDGIEITAGPIRPGCGGSSITAPLYSAICVPFDISANPNGGAGQFGAGGGGGAVLNSIGGKGGNGGDGFVILEYKSVQ